MEEGSQGLLLGNPEVALSRTLIDFLNENMHLFLCQESHSWVSTKLILN
jgi:hypothetical protein